MLTEKDLSEINSLRDERTKLITEIKKVEEHEGKKNTQVLMRVDIERHPTGYGSYSSMACMRLSKDLILYHMRARLYQVEIALKTYGIELQP